MAKKRRQPDLKIDYKTEAEPKAVAGGIPVFCAFDKIVPIADVVGNPKNPNRHPDTQIELLAQIIKSQGWRAPITVSNRSGFVVRGHGRLAAAVKLGVSEVPIDYQSYSNDAEEWADLIADNRIAELAETDNVALADLIQDMDTGEVPLILAGYSDDDLDNLLSSISGNDDTTDDGVDDVPVPPEVPISKSGDLWHLGPHRLICGDATKRATIERLMDGHKGTLVFTDPPYGVSYVSPSGKFEMIQNDDLTDDNLVQNLLLPVFRFYCEFTTDDAAFYIWHASSTHRDFSDAMTAAGIVEKQYIIWAKSTPVLGHADYQWAHEPCFYAEKAGHTAKFYGDRAQSTVWKATYRTNGTMLTTISGGIVLTDGKGNKIYIVNKVPKGKKVRYIRVEPEKSVNLFGESSESTVWEMSRDSSPEHPNQKPVDLSIRAINNSTQEGDIVLDFFGGSGSTLMGAQLSHRIAYVSEIDPKYIDVHIKRYSKVANPDTITCERDGQTYSLVDLIKGGAVINETPE